MREFGVHSEVGSLRTVMVCRPGLAHQRLPPGNRHDLLFDTGFSFLDRDAVTMFREVVDPIRCYSIYPKDADGGVDVCMEDKHLLDVVKDAPGLQELRVIATGGDSYAAERGQWNDGNNVVTLEPGGS
jgi:arginine deiminase